jgi:hypothetical protein
MEFNSAFRGLIVDCNKASGKSFSDKSSDEGHRQQEGDTVDCDLTFEASLSSSQPQLLTHGDLNDPVRDFNLSKKQAEL